MSQKPELGFLSRAGKFYPCNWTGHAEEAIEIIGDGGEKELEKTGWCILKGEPTAVTKFHWWYLADRPRYPSQRQWDFIFDWCKKKGKSFPPDHLQDLWEDQNNGI